MAEEQADQQIEVPTTKDEATDVPVGAEQSDTEEAQKKLNKDLQLQRVGLVMASRRDRERDLDPEGFERRKKKKQLVFDIEEVYETAAAFSGMTPTEYKAAAKHQSAPLLNMYEEIVLEENPVAEVLEKYKTQDSLWSKTEQQREMLSKGERVLKKGLGRLASGEKEMSAEDRKETMLKLLKSSDPKNKVRMFIGEPGEGEAEDAVVKPGQPEFEPLNAKADGLINPDIAADPELAKLYQKHISELGPVTMGSMIRNTLGEKKFNDMVNSVANYKLNRMSKREGIPRGMVGYEELKARARRDAIHEAALLRATNKFYPSGFIQWNDIDPEGWYTATKKAGNQSFLSQALSNTAKVRVEVIGVDPNGVPVYRLDSPLWHMFEIADAPMAAAAGVIERFNEDRDEGILETMREGALTGLYNRRDFLKMAMSSEAMEDGGVQAFAAGSAGIIAAVLAPDLFLGAAGAARSAKKVGDAIGAGLRLKRDAPKLIEAFGQGAENLAKTEDILSAAQTAVEKGNYDEAIRIINEAAEFARKGDAGLKEARTIDGKVGQVVDQIDTDIARRIGDRQVPEIGVVEGQRLAAQVPGSFGEVAQNIHPGARRVMMRGESVDQLIGFQELLSSEEPLKGLIEAIEFLKSGNVDKAYTVRIRRGAATPFSDELRAQMSKFGVAPLDEGLTTAQRQNAYNLTTFLDSPSTTRLLRDDPDKWQAEINGLIQLLPFRDPQMLAKFQKKADSLFNRARLNAKKAAAAGKRVSLEDAQKATASAIRAVRANMESRAAASAFVREQVAERAGVSAEPLLVSLTDKYAAIGRERLAPETLTFMDQIVKEFPELEGDDALKIGRLLDKEMRKIADAKGDGKGARTLSDTFRERLVGLIRESKEGEPRKLADAEVPSTPRAPDPADPPKADAPDVPDDAPVEAAIERPSVSLAERLRAPDTAAAIERELKLLTPFPVGSIATAPKRKDLPKLKARASENVTINPQATFGPSQGGLSAAELYDHIKVMTNTVDVAKFLMKHAKNDSTRAIMRRILPTLRKNPGRFDVVDNLSDSNAIRLEAQDAIGLFNVSDNSIVVRGANWEKTGLSEEVLSHELLHAATGTFIRSNPDNKAVKELSELNDEVMDLLEARLPELEGDNLTRIENVIAAMKGNPEEFVTYALTNRRFQTLLNSIEVAPKRTVWNKFTRLLARMFGFRGVSEESALARALVSTDAVIRGAKKFADISTDATPVVKQVDDVPDMIEVTSPFLEEAGQGGGIMLRQDTRFNVPVLRVDSVEIPENLRGQGLGVDLYLRALKQAQSQKAGFISDIAPNEEATRVYRSLEALGVKFTRKPVKDAQGELGDAFFVSPRDLEKLDLDAAVLKNSERQIGEQLPMFARAEKPLSSEPLVVEFLENGQAIIRAMGDTATVEDFVRAIGKIARRDLDDKGMSAVVAWLASKGIKVGYQGATFTADDAATVERAEDEFAKAFAEYVRSGRADEPELVKSFQTTRDWLADRYAALRGAETDGATLDIDEGLQSALDALLRVPEKRVGMPNILALARDALLKGENDGTTVNVIDEIVRESFRLGKPVNRKALMGQYERAVKAYEEGRLDDAVIRLETPVTIRGWIASGNNPSKTEFTVDELADIQFSLEQAKRLEAQEVGRIPLGGTEQAIIEKTPSEIFDQASTQPGLKQALRAIYLGGDAFADMRALPPKVRDAIMAGTRRVQQAVGDAITLVSEKNVDGLMRLVTGVPDVTFEAGGRSAISAGHDSMADVSNMLKQFFEGLDNDTKEILDKYVTRLRMQEAGTPGRAAKALDTFSPEDRAKIAEAFNDAVNGPKASRFVSDVFQAAGMKPTRIEPRYLAQPAEGLDPSGLLEILMYYGNVTTRRVPIVARGPDGVDKSMPMLFENVVKSQGKQDVSSQLMFNGLYEDINKLFGDDPRVANRVAILIHAHGTASAAKKRWVDLGLAADEKLATAMKRYVIGEQIDGDEAIRVRNAFESLGYNPVIVEGYNLDGSKLYVPQAARQRIDMALSQAQDPELLKIDDMDTISALNAIGARAEEILGGSGTNSSTALSFAIFYRYIKTRMVRGHFVLKSRYFWMNTFDHFNQVATRSGFPTAMVSATRLFTQNVLANPVGQTAVFAARRAGRGDAVEAFRRKLQDFGDEGAKWAGKLTRGSKWHIKLNPILEGSDGIVNIGGKPYRNRDIRQIALEAGIFASFDTSQLGTKIRNVGNLFLTQQKESGRLTQMGKDILEDVKGASEDIAEAWAERERLGCMITLMEAGIDPQTAAKISIDALYDYAGSMSKGDRNFLLNMFFPFWAFQKNANRQIFDAIFSPEGAYRLGVMRRAYDKGSELLSHLTYEAYVDEYGVATDSLPPELKDTYFAIKKGLLDTFGENGRIPAPVQEQIRMYIAMSQVKFTGGKALELDPDMEKLIDKVVLDVTSPLKAEDGENLGLDRRALASYYMAKPDRSSRPGWLRDQTALVEMIYPPATYEPPEDFQNSTKVWNDLYRQRNPDAPYFALFMPESTQAAAFKHFTYLLSVKLLMAKEIEDMGDRWFTDEDDGSDAISPINALNALLNPTRAPVLSDLAATLGAGGATMPKRVHPDLVYYYEMIALDVLELDEKEDLNNMILDQQAAEDAGEDVKALPRKSAGSEIRAGKKYYMMPGVGQLLFSNSPFGELNDLLLKMDKTGPEEAAGLRGDIQRFARVATGLNTKDIAPERSAVQGAAQARGEVPAEVFKRATKKEKLK